MVYSWYKLVLRLSVRTSVRHCMHNSSFQETLHAQSKLPRLIVLAAVPRAVSSCSVVTTLCIRQRSLTGLHQYQTWTYVHSQPFEWLKHLVSKTCQIILCGVYIRAKAQPCFRPTRDCYKGNGSPKLRVCLDTQAKKTSLQCAHFFICNMLQEA